MGNPEVLSGDLSWGQHLQRCRALGAYRGAPFAPAGSSPEGDSALAEQLETLVLDDSDDEDGSAAQAASQAVQQEGLEMPTFE